MAVGHKLHYIIPSCAKEDYEGDFERENPECANTIKRNARDQVLEMGATKTTNAEILNNAGPVCQQQKLCLVQLFLRSNKLLIIQSRMQRIKTKKRERDLLPSLLVVQQLRSLLKLLKLKTMLKMVKSPTIEVEMEEGFFLGDAWRSRSCLGVIFVNYILYIYA